MAADIVYNKPYDGSDWLASVTSPHITPEDQRAYARSENKVVSWCLVLCLAVGICWANNTDQGEMVFYSFFVALVLMSIIRGVQKYNLKKTVSIDFYIDGSWLCGDLEGNIFTTTFTSDRHDETIKESNLNIQNKEKARLKYKKEPKSELYFQDAGQVNAFDKFGDRYVITTTSDKLEADAFARKIVTAQNEVQTALRHAYQQH